MAQNKTMAIKHKKARVEAMKEANEISLRGVMGDVQAGRVVVVDGVGMYFTHKRYMDKRKVV